MCFIDIACDEIPERYYKESEVRDPNGRITDALTHLFIPHSICEALPMPRILPSVFMFLWFSLDISRVL